jgi:hypothetical protein
MPADVTVRITAYAVSALPPDHLDAEHFTLAVEWRGNDRWAILDGQFCLNADGGWDYELRPSEREDDWLNSHRFDLATALHLATKAAAVMKVNGSTVADVLARVARRKGATS